MEYAIANLKPDIAQYGLIILACCYSLTSYGMAQFGYISYSTYNIGDDIQALAAKRFLPRNSIAIDREFIGPFKHPKKIKTILNGWYMHTKDFCWYRADVPAPDKSWPPSACLDPLIISLHLADGFVSTGLSEEGIEYLKKHAPIGARDFSTLKALQQKGIDCYFSGCLTLTLENTCKQRDPIIYAVDIDDECVEFIRSHTKYKVERISHVISNPHELTNRQRFKLTRKILEKYKRAHCVITCRLHASMPCLAFGTPVLLILNKNDHYRFDGLQDLVRRCSKDDLLKGLAQFDCNNPPENPKDYLALRENLINTVRAWVTGNK